MDESDLVLAVVVGQKRNAFLVEVGEAEVGEGEVTMAQLVGGVWLSRQFSSVFLLRLQEETLPSLVSMREV